MNPPPRPTPPQVQHVCDKCLKPWGTCYCRAFYIVASVLIVVGLIGNTVAYVLIEKGVL